MKYQNIISILAVIVILVAIVNISVSIFKISEYNKQITGFASGYVNITVDTQITINVTQDTINFGRGIITSGQLNATLYTNGAGTSVVERGNWSTAIASPIVVENIGNINASLKITAGKNASDFFDSATGSNQEYMINVSNKDAGSCNGGPVSLWNSANVTEVVYCNQLDFNTNRNEVYVNVKLTVPYDARNIDAQSDILTISGDTAV